MELWHLILFVVVVLEAIGALRRSKKASIQALKICALSYLDNIKALGAYKATTKSLFFFTYSEFTFKNKLSRSQIKGLHGLKKQTLHYYRSYDAYVIVTENKIKVFIR